MNSPALSRRWLLQTSLVGVGVALASEFSMNAALRTLPGTTAIVVRHAEQLKSPGDPSLSPEGAARAERLSAMLREQQGGAPIARVFSSEYRRTKETAEAIAKPLGLEVTVVAARDETALIKQLTSGPKGAASVVVGHSNTVPAIVKALSQGHDAPVVADDDFGSLFVVHRPLFGPATVVRLRY